MGRFSWTRDCTIDDYRARVVLVVEGTLVFLVNVMCMTLKLFSDRSIFDLGRMGIELSASFGGTRVIRRRKKRTMVGEHRAP